MVDEDSVVNVNEVLTGKQLLTEDQWREREGNLIERNGLDDVLQYGWNDLTSGQKIAIGAMRERIDTLKEYERGYKKRLAEKVGQVEVLERLIDRLIDKALKAVDLTGRL